MFCHKDRTAVFVRLDRCLISIDLQGYIHDLLFIKTDHRTEYRKGADFVGRCKTLHGLACYLSDAFSCDQSQASGLFRDVFCDTHHVTSHNDCEFIMRAFIINIQLNVSKVYDMQNDRSAVFRHQTCQVNHFLFCTLTGVWRCMEINGINLNAAFCDHVACNRAVNSTG